jgi:RNA polymerase sigma factor (sigma-70 family)
VPDSPPRTATDELLQLTDVIRRVVRARVSRSEDVEDLVQETLVRVAEAQHRLDPATLASYAAVTARNLVVTKYRRDGGQRRHIHRLVEYNTIGDPEELALRREENDALAVALSRVPEADRELLLFHEVDGIDTATLAAQSHSTPGGVAMRLSRARALLRLEFVLALRGVQLTSARCRAVLLAISSGDTRRQDSLDAATHLATCPTCGALSAPLVEKRRAIAGWLPFGGILAALRALPRKLRTPKGQAVVAGATATVVAAAIAITALSGGTRDALTAQRAATPTTAAPVPALPVLTAGGALILPLPPEGLAPHAAAPVQARGVPVLELVAGGAWIGVNDQQRVWIEFHDPVDGSVLSAPPVPLQVGQHLDFAGSLAANSDGMASDLGFSPTDASLLDAEAFHVHVQLDTLVVH